MPTILTKRLALSLPFVSSQKPGDQIIYIFLAAPRHVHLTSIQLVATNFSDRHRETNLRLLRCCLFSQP